LGETPEGLLRPQTIRVGLYEKLKLNGTGSGDCYAELPRIHLLETVWKIAGRV
jgi:hypothetical protein